MVKFEIDGVYENRRGKYTIIALDDVAGMATIRYRDTGETATSRVSTLTNAWRSILADRTREAEHAARERKRRAGHLGGRFAGLTESEFSQSFAGTTWRSRHQLAGLVARVLSEESGLDFLSHDIYRWQRAFLAYRGLDDLRIKETGTRRAKFMLEITEAELSFGFYVERNSQEMDENWDWRRFERGLQAGQVQRIILDAEGTGFRFIAKTGHDEDLWPTDDLRAVALEERVETLLTCPAGAWLNVYLIAAIPKEEALRLGYDLGRRVAERMLPLVPLYKMVARET